MMILRVRRRHLSVLVIVHVCRWRRRRNLMMMMSSRRHHSHHVRNVHSRFSRREFLLRQRFLHSMMMMMILVALPSIPRVRATRENNKNHRQEVEKNETRRTRDDSFHLLSLCLCLSVSLFLSLC